MYIDKYVYTMLLRLSLTLNNLLHLKKRDRKTQQREISRQVLYQSFANKFQRILPIK